MSEQSVAQFLFRLIFFLWNCRSPKCLIIIAFLFWRLFSRNVLSPDWHSINCILMRIFLYCIGASASSIPLANTFQYKRKTIVMSVFFILSDDLHWFKLLDNKKSKYSVNCRQKIMNFFYKGFGLKLRRGSHMLYIRFSKTFFANKFEIFRPFAAGLINGRKLWRS